jgi:hypothetical protein
MFVGGEGYILWSLSLPPKVKSFLWRACLGILPMHELLWRRHLHPIGLCPCCCHETEFVGHTLWSCPVANDVWLESKLKLQKWDRSVNNFYDLILCVRLKLSLDEIELFSCVAYFIWSQRNKMVHEGIALDPVA